MKERKYKAFISYSHKDEKFATWLHKKLETYKIPKQLQENYSHKLPNKLFPIFRDRAELSTSPTLGEEILKALTNSEYLIVICSTYSAKSQYVNQEIIDFKRIHGEDKVHAIIIDGEPHAKESDKFDDDLECFPEALKYEVIDGKLSDIPIEPIAGDFRKGKDGKREAKLKLLAGLLAVDFDDLNQRENQRRNKKYLIWGIVGSILFIMMLGLTIFSLYQKDIAQEELNKANNNLGLIFFEQSQQSLKDRDLSKVGLLLYNSLKLIKDKYDFDNSKSHIKNILQSTIINSIHRVFLTDSNKTKSILISPDNKNIITVHKNYFEIRDIKNWNLLKKIEDKNRDKNDSITCVALSRDNKYIVEGSRDGNIRVWNRNNNRLERIFKAHKTAIEHLILSYDSQYIISSSYNGIIKIGSLAKTKLFRILTKHINLKSTNLTGIISAIDISADNNYIVLGTNNRKLYIYDFRTKKTKISSIKTNGVVHHIKITPDSKKIIYTTPAPNIKIIDIESKKILKVLKGHQDKPINLILSSDGKEVISTSYKGVMRIWNIKSGEIKNIVHAHPLHLKEYDTYENLNSTLIWTELVSSITGDNNTIATTSDNGIIVSLGLFDNTIQIFERDTNIMRNYLKGDIYIENMALSSNGKNIYTGGINGKIQVWNLGNKKMIEEFQAHKWNISKIIISNNNTKIYSSGQVDGMIKIWDINTTKMITSWNADENGISSIALSSNNRYLASVGFLSKDIKIWDIENNNSLVTSFLGRNGSKCIEFTPDNKKIIYVSEDEKVVDIRDIKSKKIIYRLKGHKGKITTILVSHNKKMIITGSSDMSIKLWDIENGKLIRTIKKAHTYDITDLSISNNDKYIVSVSRNNVMKIWNIKNGNLIFIHRLLGNYNGQTHVTINSNNIICLSTSKDKYIEIIDKNIIDKLNNKKYIDKKISLLEKELQIKLNGVKIEKNRQYFNKILWSKEHPYFWINNAIDGNTSAMYNLALLYDIQNKNSKALYWYQKAIDNGNIKARERFSILKGWLKSEIYVKKLLTEAILSVKNNNYKESRKKYTKAISICKELIKNNKNINFLNKKIKKLSLLYWQHAQYNNFLDLNNKIILLLKKSTVVNKEDFLAYSYFYIGKFSLLSNDKKKAIKYFKKSKEEFKKKLNKSSGFNAPIYLNIFQLSLLTNEEFDKEIEIKFQKKYFNHKDRNILYFYRLFKGLSNVSLKRENDIYLLKDKYSKYPITFLIKKWIELSEPIVKNELEKFLAKIIRNEKQILYIDLI